MLPWMTCRSHITKLYLASSNSKIIPGLFPRPVIEERKNHRRLSRGRAGKPLLRSRQPYALALAVRHPQTIILPAVVNILITGSIALFFLNSADQVSLCQSGVILHPQITSFGSDILKNHRLLLLWLPWAPLPTFGDCCGVYRVSMRAPE